MVCDYVTSIGYGVRDLDFSPVKGPEGNIEYLLHIENNGESKEYDIPAVVAAAHKELDK